MTDIEPDARVKASMNEINAAQRTRVAAADQAEAQKIILVKQAEAEAESKYLAGVGVARQRRAIVDGLRDSVLAFSGAVDGTAPKDVMDLLLINQYFDTLKDIGAHSKSTTIFVPHSPGGIADIAHQVRDGFMQASQGMIHPADTAPHNTSAPHHTSAASPQHMANQRGHGAQHRGGNSLDLLS